MALNDIIVPKEAVVGVLSEVVLTPAEIGASASEPADDIFRVVGSADPTKKVAFEVDGLATATTSTLTVPASGTIARTEDFASPPAIGSTTPNTAAFTTLTASSLVASGNVASDSNLRMRSNTGQISLGGSNDVLLFRGAANVLELRSGTNPQTFRLYNTYTSASNHERGFMRWSSNVLQIGTEKGSVGGSARPIGINVGSIEAIAIAINGEVTVRSRIYISTGSKDVAYTGLGSHAFSSVGTFSIRPWSGSACRINIGGDTSSFPALKRDTTTLQVKLADDSAFTAIQGKLTTETAYTAGAPTATGYLVLYDSNGTAYKVPAEAL
jgi:hypothetical protein